MYELHFSGINADTLINSVSVVGNNEADIIRFVVEKVQQSISLSGYNCYIKVQNKSGSYINKEKLDVVEGEQLTIDWHLTFEYTQYKELSCQLQFQSDDTNEVVWQSKIFYLKLQSTIAADRYIETHYPTELKQIETQLENHEERIEALENKEEIGSVDLSLEGDNLDVAIKDSEGEIIASDSVELPLSSKVDKTNSADKVYGTDANGEQTTYDANSFGKVDDVQVNGYSVVVNKVANIDLSLYATEVEVQAITALIPAQASSENQLADKNFVNSSIATNTAYFRGTYANVSALLSYSGELTNNDYANVINSARDFTDTTEMNAFDKSLLTNFDFAWIPNDIKYDLYRFNVETQVWSLQETSISKDAIVLPTVYNRYTYNGQTETWSWNYSVNTSGFTANQWASINSGITAQMVGDMALKSVDETVSGNWTFTAKIFIGNKELRSVSNDLDYYVEGTRYLSLQKTQLFPRTNNFSLGRNANRFHSVYAQHIDFNGVLKNETKNANYGLALPDTTGYTANKTIATDDQAFNVINASDIVSNTLTQAQYDLITNGKPTLIKGTLVGLTDLFLFAPHPTFSDYHGGICVARNSTSNEQIIIMYEFRESTKVFQVNNISNQYILKITSSNKVQLSGANGTELPYLISINSKTIPNYPTDTTKQYKLVQQVGGTLAYVEDINSTTEITTSDITASIPTGIEFSVSDSRITRHNGEIKLTMRLAITNTTSASISVGNANTFRFKISEIYSSRIKDKNGVLLNTTGDNGVGISASICFSDNGVTQFYFSSRVLAITRYIANANELMLQIRDMASIGANSTHNFIINVSFPLID